MYFKDLSSIQTWNVSSLECAKKKSMFSLNTMAMTAIHLDWLCFGFNVTPPQLRNQNIVICNNPTAGDTGKAEVIGKADTAVQWWCQHKFFHASFEFSNNFCVTLFFWVEIALITQAGISQTKMP